MKRASMFGFIGAILLIVGDLAELLYWYFLANNPAVTLGSGITGPVMSTVAGLLFPISFMYILYTIQKNIK